MKLFPLLLASTFATHATDRLSGLSSYVESTKTYLVDWCMTGTNPDNSDLFSNTMDKLASIINGYNAPDGIPFEHKGSSGVCPTHSSIPRDKYANLITFTYIPKNSTTVMYVNTSNKTEVALGRAMSWPTKKFCRVFVSWSRGDSWHYKKYGYSKTALHETLHCLGAHHVADSTGIMYYAMLGKRQVPITKEVEDHLRALYPPTLNYTPPVKTRMRFGSSDFQICNHKPRCTPHEGLIDSKPPVLGGYHIHGPDTFIRRKVVCGGVTWSGYIVADLIPNTHGEICDILKQAPLGDTSEWIIPVTRSVRVENACMGRFSNFLKGVGMMTGDSLLIEISESFGFWRLGEGYAVHGDVTDWAWIHIGGLDIPSPEHHVFQISSETAAHVEIVAVNPELPFVYSLTIPCIFGDEKQEWVRLNDTRLEPLMKMGFESHELNIVERGSMVAFYSEGRVLMYNRMDGTFTEKLPEKDE